MSSAKDFRVTLEYGATSPPYTPQSPHRGRDRGTPMRTMLFEGDDRVLTGNSGFTFGPHVHIQAGNDFYAQDHIDPTKYEFQPGEVVHVGTADQWGLHVILKVKGKYVVYAHLFSAAVQPGDIMGKGGFVYQIQPPVFKWDYYLDKNPDVKRHGDSREWAEEHWLKNGINEGRPSAPNFHIKEYRANYPDLDRNFGKDFVKYVEHYYYNGINEKRNGRTIAPADFVPYEGDALYTRKG